jgi:RNA polymerase sigma factor for flagellar operon FliA
MRMNTAAAEVNLEDCNRLVLDHVELVKTLAARLAHRVPAHIEFNELVSVGMMGLVEAARRFKPALGVPFDAFARRRVHGAMVDSLRGMDWAPRSVRRMRREIDSAISQLRHSTKREPTELEIAGALSVSETDYAKMLDQIRAVDLAALRQLESPDEQPLLELAIESEEGPHAKLEREELRQHLVKAILQLPERERQILSLYYEHELTLAEIGTIIGVGESRVSQIRTQAIARLRSSLRESLQLSEGR